MTRRGAARKELGEGAKGGGGEAPAGGEARDRALAASLAALEADELRRFDRPLRRVGGGKVEVEGRLLTDFSSNDYLGMASDPRPAAEGARALMQEGVGSGAARLISGTHPLHRELEGAFADFVRRPAALLFSTGYAANLGAIPALAGRGDLLLSDERNHASLIDGCRLSRAEVQIFPHRDLRALERLLTAHAGRGGERWIVVEGVYSMEGDLAPLPEIVALARAHGARIYLDDAHGIGVLGATGRGTAEHFGVEEEIDALMGTLGKAFGASGALVAGSELLRGWLLNRARPFFFSTAPPPAIAAAALAALRIVRDEPERRVRLRWNAHRVADGLARLGHPAPGGVPGHIATVPIGAAGETIRVAHALEARGYLVGAIRPPSVPSGKGRLRLGVSAEHGAGEIDGLLAALAELLPPGAA